MQIDLPPTQPSYVFKDKTYQLSFVCQHDENHEFDVWVRYIASPEGSDPPKIKGRIIKVGQFPSLADLHTGEIQKYRKALGKDYTELSKAVGLNAHDVGIGAFVYLRRIFERLVTDAYNSAKSFSTWTQENEIQFAEQKRMGEKIAFLGQFQPPVLPALLVKNHQMYGILSKGIHELEEDECKTYFPVMFKGICLILDDRLATKEREKNEQELNQSIQNIQSQMKSS